MNNNDILLFTESIWSQLTDNILKGNYVLVLGNEAILDKEKTEGISDSKLLFEKIRKKRRSEDDNFAEMSKYDQILELVRNHNTY